MHREALERHPPLAPVFFRLDAGWERHRWFPKLVKQAMARAKAVETDVSERQALRQRLAEVRRPVGGGTDELLLYGIRPRHRPRGLTKPAYRIAARNVLFQHGKISQQAFLAVLAELRRWRPSVGSIKTLAYPPLRRGEERMPDRLRGTKLALALLWLQGSAGHAPDGSHGNAP
jgi:hypothetical protein